MAEKAGCDKYYEVKKMIKEAIDSGLNDVCLYSKIANAIMEPELRNIVLSMIAEEYGQVRTWAVLCYMYDHMDECCQEDYDSKQQQPSCWEDRPPYCEEPPSYDDQPPYWEQPPCWEDRPPCCDEPPCYDDERPPYFDEYPCFNK